jgi:hypothetical protein
MDIFFYLKGLRSVKSKNVISALRGINGYSAGNHQLMDEESTWRMFIPPGITSSGTRNLPEE